MICKISFTNWNEKIALLQESMVVTYYIKLFWMGANRHNCILMSLLLLVAETIKILHEKILNVIYLYWFHNILVENNFTKWSFQPTNLE